MCIPILAPPGRRIGPNRASRPPRSRRGRRPRAEAPVAIGPLLAVEELPAGQADDTGADAVGDQLLVGLDGQRDLAAGGDQDHLGIARRDRRARSRHAAVPRRRRTCAVEDRHVLACQDQRDGPVVAVDRRPPRLGDLVRVGGADHVEAGDRAQAGELLDRLVGRAVLAEADRVMGEDVDHRQLHQGGEPDRRAARSRRRSGRWTTSGAASRARARSRSPPTRARGCRSGTGRPCARFGLERLRCPRVWTEVEPVRSAEPATARGPARRSRSGPCSRPSASPCPSGRARSSGCRASQPSGSSRRCIASSWRASVRARRR